MAGVAAPVNHLKDAAADATMAVEDASPVARAGKPLAGEAPTPATASGKKPGFFEKLKQKQAEKAAEK
jgi:hypothetical protein